MEFDVLIVGSDANAYYMARCYHEEYGKKANLLIKSYFTYTKYSNILNVIEDDSIWTEDGFLEALENFRLKNPNKKIVLISTNETYTEFIVKNQDKINEQYVYNYPSLEIIDNLIFKDKFYQTYQDSILDLPKTYYYYGDNQALPSDLTFPVILKPSNVSKYNHINFAGKKKIYKLYNLEDLKFNINNILNNGYDDTLIIQEYIPGDDSYLFDAVVYSNKEKQVKQISFAQIGLQDHNKSMIGNATVLINGFNQFGGTKEIVDKIKQFMEDIGYQGFAEFDIKYDARDKKFKVLEINARQGRSSYYISPLGFNLVKTLIDDLIFNKDVPYKFIDQERLLSFVPKGIIKKYIVNKTFRKKALSLWKRGQVISPIKYSKDTNFIRRLILLRIDFNYYKSYRNGDWDNK